MNNNDRLSIIAKNLSNYITSVDNQIDEDGNIRWYFSVSFATDLLAGASRIIEFDLDKNGMIINFQEREVTSDFTKYASLFLRPIGDMDICNIGNYTMGAISKVNYEGMRNNVTDAGDLWNILYRGRGTYYDRLNAERIINNHKVARVIMDDDSSVIVTSPLMLLAFKNAELFFATVHENNQIINKDMRDIVLMYAFTKQMYTDEEIVSAMIEGLQNRALDLGNDIMSKEIIEEVTANLEKCKKQTIKTLDINDIILRMKGTYEQVSTQLYGRGIK